MSDTTVAPVRNRLLRAMHEDDRCVLIDACELVRLRPRFVLARADQVQDDVYFLEDGVASVVATADERRIEVGIYGRDGMSGACLLLGVDRTPHEHFIQIAGGGRRLSALDFRAFIEDRPRARALLLRYVQVVAVQTAQTALANGAYTIRERLARWLLMCDDRVDGREIPLTHEFLSLMLGVRRSSVTVALHALEADALIKAIRSHVQILDREKLQAIAGHSYGVPEAEYGRLVGPL